MKSLVIFIAFLGFVHYSEQTDKCGTKVSGPELTFPQLYNYRCLNEIAAQVNNELSASIAYLQMSADFSSEKNFRPGVAQFFLESAKEERGHAKKLIEYYLMRGGNMQNITIEAIKNDNYQSQTNIITALKAALDLEKKVTGNIRSIIVECGKTICPDNEPNCVKEWEGEDYHAIDFLTGEFLSEQHEGIRKISDMLKTRSVLSNTFGTLADVIFDQNLQQELKGE